MITAGSSMSPTGWDFAEGLDEVDWLALDPTFAGVPGMALAGFSFQSGNPPGTINFAALFADASSGVFSESVSRFAIGPGPAASSTPEPSSLFLVATALCVGALRIPGKWGHL